MGERWAKDEITIFHYLSEPADKKVANCVYLSESEKFMSTEYSGAQWVKNTFNVAMSPLGENVANLLGKVFCGIYHLDMGKLKKVDWSNRHFIAIQLHWMSLSTFDNEDLTRLVVLTHDHCLRMEISAKTVRTLELMFHQRQPVGDVSHRMPTMEKHLADIRRYHPARLESQDEYVRS